MPNVYASPDKLRKGRALLGFGLRALREQGYAIENVPGRRNKLLYLSKGGHRSKVVVRTSQDTAFAFPRKRTGSGWVTLDEADQVLVSSVDDFRQPKRALVHLIPGDVVRAHFDRAYAARKKAHHALPPGRGIWLALYKEELESPVSSVGAGLGLLHPPIAEVDLRQLFAESSQGAAHTNGVTGEELELGPNWLLTIPEAKRRLAATLGVPEASIRITIEH